MFVTKYLEQSANSDRFARAQMLNGQVTPYYYIIPALSCCSMCHVCKAIFCFEALLQFALHHYLFSTARYLFKRLHAKEPLFLLLWSLCSIVFNKYHAFQFFFNISNQFLSCCFIYFHQTQNQSIKLSTLPAHNVA